MPTAAWTGFLHSWHTLGIVLKWMCITVVGIPAAIVTCLLVAAAVLAFAILCLLSVAAGFYLFFLIFKGIWMISTRTRYWIDEIKFHRAERKLSTLPTSEKLSYSLRWPKHSTEATKAAERIPEGYMSRRVQESTITVSIGNMEIQVPKQVHLKINNEVLNHQEEERQNVNAIIITELPKMRECKICLEDHLPSNFPVRTPTTGCEHAADDCCISCLTRAITNAFETNMWDDIRCPVCNLGLKHEDIAALAPRDVFERYDALSLRRTLELELPNFRWCMRPSCSFGQEHFAPAPLPSSPGEDVGKVACSACRFEMCFWHNVPWHTGRTCDEWDRKVKVRERRSERAVRRVAKKCPGCGKWVNKDGGCLHMTCLCGKEWCWNCGHTYPGHTWACYKADGTQ